MYDTWYVDADVDDGDYQYDGAWERVGGDPRWFAEEAERTFAAPYDGGDVDCELCGEVHEADVECG